MRLGSSTSSELLAEVDGTVEREASVRVDIDVLDLKVCRNVHDTNIAGLNEIVTDDKMLLVWSDLNVV